MTLSLGINYGLVSTLVFLFGIALAGVAGVIGTPIPGAYPSMGDALLLLTLIVVVVGGTGYIQGTMLGALVIGLLDTFGKAYVPQVALFSSSSSSSCCWSGRAGSSEEDFLMDQDPPGRTAMAARAGSAPDHRATHGRARSSRWRTQILSASSSCCCPVFLPSCLRVQPGDEDDDPGALRREPEPHLGVRQHTQFRSCRLLRRRRLHLRR